MAYFDDEKNNGGLPQQPQSDDGAAGFTDETPVDGEQTTGFEQDAADYAQEVIQRPVTTRKKKKRAALTSLQRSIIKTVCVVLAFIIIVTAGCLALSTSIFASATGLKIGDIEVPVYEYNFNYWTEVHYFNEYYSSYLGDNAPDLSKPLKDQVYYFDESMSWEDYFKDFTSSYLVTAMIMYQKAVDMGLELTEGDKREIDLFMQETLQESADYNKVTLQQFIEVMYGKTLNESRVRTCLEHIYLAQQYNEYYQKTLTVSDEEVESWLTEYESQFAGVTYRIFAVKPASDEAEDIVDAKNVARDFISKITDEQSFVELARQYATDSEKENYEEDGATLAYFQTLDEVGDTSLTDWLFEEGRQPGDKTIIYSPSQKLAFALLYLNYGFPPDLSANIYSIFIATGTAANPDDAAAKAAIEKVKQEFVDGGATVEQFKKLVALYSEDTYSLSNEGYYENSLPKSMVDSVAAWCYSGTRQIGDYDTVAGDEGYFLLYYAGTGLPIYRAQAISDIKDSKLTDYQGELLESATPQTTKILDFMIGK